MYILAGGFVLGQSVTEYVLVNNNKLNANSLIIYELKTNTGQLRKISVLRTGGQGLGGERDLSGVQQAISADKRCIFGLNIYSSDIAAFSEATGYQRVGNYFDQNLISGAEGDSIALSPDGRFLYASYTRTGNLGAWKVGSDCSLTLIAISASFSQVGPLEVTPSQEYLLARGLGAMLPFAIDQVTGSLTELNAVQFMGGACARQGACLPYGIQISQDSKLAVFSSFAPDVRREQMIPVILTARITPTGLMYPTVRDLTIENNLRLNDFPFLSAAGYEGNGPIYLGVTTGGGQYTPGILTAGFTERPVKFAVTNSTVANPEVGNIAVTGNTMVVAQYPNQISVFRIKKNGSLKLLSTTTINDQGEGMFSLSIFPNTR
jgi:hypothetical protein